MSCDKAVQETECLEPYIASDGSSYKNCCNPVVVLECNTILQRPSLFMGVICGFMSYYIYGIKYPVSMRPFFF